LFFKLFSIRLALLTLSCIVLTACNSQSTALRLGNTVWAGYEPLYLAQSLGYYPEKDVKLVHYTSQQQLKHDLRTGIIDAAALSLSDTLLLQDKGVALIIFLVTDIVDNTIHVLAIRHDSFQQKGVLPQIQYVINGWFQALTHLDKNPQKAAAVLGQRMGLNIQQTLARYHYLTLPNALQNQALIAGSPPALLSTALQQQHTLRQQKKLHHHKDIQQLFASDIVQNLFF
jgi:ABC-type nitrate/sulfonate/bicarbonate transport system substrate-binding protein